MASRRGDGQARAALRETADRTTDKLSAFYEAALDASKELHVTCEKCSRSTRAVVPDWASRLKAVEALLNQGYGRAAGEDEQSVTLVVKFGLWAAPDGFLDQASDEERATISEANEIIDRLNEAARAPS